MYFTFCDCFYRIIFIGSEETHNKIVENWWYTFPLRVLSSIFIGLIFFIPVFLLNLFIGKFEFKKIREFIPFKQLFIIIFLGSLIGNIIFYLL